MSSPAPVNDAELAELLSRPSDADQAALDRLAGDILVLGAGGKMGPSLARLAYRASESAGTHRRIIAASRFRTGGVAAALAAVGVEPIPCDLLEQGTFERLPDAPNVVLMVGQKFGADRAPETTWATNVLVPALAVERFGSSRIVAFSTGNVYPLMPVTGMGATEETPLDPIGDYAQSAAARERVLGFLSRREGTPMAILRLSYAVELRYGVLRDLADRVWRDEPIDLSMGYVNVIWQRDACSIALRALAECVVPPYVVNVTGPQTLSVRELAAGLGRRLGKEPEFTGEESDSALLSDASLCVRRFGAPSVGVETLLDWTADWVRRGGTSLGKPTHFERRDGRF